MKGHIFKVVAAGLWMFCHAAYAGTHHYYYTDPQGTVLAKADASGTIVANFDYAPYGTAVASMSPAPNGPGYTGHVNDPDSGLVYMQARYYDPVVGRFLSVDPVKRGPGDTLGMDRFAYVNNNPIMHTDPSGMEPKHGKDMHICDSPVPCSDGFSVNWSKLSKQVDQVFENYRVESSNGNGSYNAVLADMPSELRMALEYILVSPTGQSVAREAISEGATIGFIEVPGNARAGFRWDVASGLIQYITNVASLKGTYKDPAVFAQINVPLDVNLMHEIGHTWIGRRALGITTHISTRENEFEVVRKAENPYRYFYGIDLRTSYGPDAIPEPVISQ